MATKAAELAISVTTDASDAVAGFDKAGQAALDMGRDVETASDAAERAARGLGVTADAADELGGKAGKATGALGALSSGFELVGAEKYAGALQGAALATDFMSGVGDSLNLVMESTIVQNIRARAATIAKAVAEKAAAAASKALAAAQWILNAAMAANPIGLVVLAIVALAAGFVLAYKKSETFRNVVNTVTKLVIGYLKLVTLPIRTIIDLVGGLINKIPGLSKAFRLLKEVGKSVGNAILTPFRAVRDLIQKIIDLIGKIKIPDLPDIKGGGVPFVPGLRTVAGRSDQPVVVNQITLTGLLDSRDAVRTIEQLFAREGRRMGFQVVSP